MHYRVYYLDRQNKFVDVHAFRAPGDLAAIIKAGPRHNGELRELWNQERKVLGFPG